MLTIEVPVSNTTLPEPMAHQGTGGGMTIRRHVRLHLVELVSVDLQVKADGRGPSGSFTSVRLAAHRCTAIILRAGPCDQAWTGPTREMVGSVRM